LAGFCLVAGIGFTAFALLGVDARLLADASQGSGAWWLHQWWFNFAGALIGWIALWVLIGGISAVDSRIRHHDGLWGMGRAGRVHCVRRNHGPIAVFGRNRGRRPARTA